MSCNPTAWIRKAVKILLPVLSKGKHTYIDVTDIYLMTEYAPKAGHELEQDGIVTCCLTLDPNTDNHVKRIFRANNHTVIDHGDRLPDQFPFLFANLTSQTSLYILIYGPFRPGQARMSPPQFKSAEK